MFNTEESKDVWSIADILERGGSVKKTTRKKKTKAIIPEALSTKGSMEVVPEGLGFDDDLSILEIEEEPYRSFDEASYAARSIVELEILKLTHGKRKNPEKVEYLSETLHSLGGHTQITLTPYEKYSIKTVDQVDPLD